MFILLWWVNLNLLHSSRFDSESSPENRLYLDCFCVVAGGIGVSLCLVGGCGLNTLVVMYWYDESSHITTVF